MNDASYTLKISSQGQLTLPRELREQLHVQPGSRIAVAVTGNGVLRISTKPPIADHFGALAGAWTGDGQDAADYARNLRNSMQTKL